MKHAFLLALSFSLLISYSAAQTAAADKVINDGTFPKTDWNFYSGYLQLSPTKYFHYMFFESNSSTQSSDPVILWLNGGPGCSSLLGAFQENGPFLFNVNATGFQPGVNPYSWNMFANVLYIESPAGVLSNNINNPFKNF